MSMTMGWMKTQSWSWAMQCACIYQGRQSKDNDTNWQQKETTKTKDLHCMMTHAFASTALTERSHVLQVSQVTSHIVGFHSLLHVINFNYCRCNYLLNFDLYANSLQRFTLRKRVLWGVVFAHPVGCSRPPSAVNESHRLRHRRNPRPRGAVARGTVARSWTPDWTRRKSLWGSCPWAHNLCGRRTCQ